MHAVSHQPLGVSRRASLSMYDLPELRRANDRLWAAIAARLEAAGIADVPRGLDRDEPPQEVWTDPGLLLAQTCGYPLAKRLHNRVRLVATPRYRAEGCRGPNHSSAVIVRAEDPARVLADVRGAKLAVNDLESGSGMNLLRAAIAPLAGGRPFFGPVTVTGSHIASIQGVASGDADVSAIDAVTWAHVRRWRPRIAARLRVLTWTEECPGLPLITAATTDHSTLAVLQGVLQDVVADPASAEARETLLLEGFSLLQLQDYDAVFALKRRAIEQRYPILR